LWGVSNISQVIIEDAHYIPSRRSLLENGIISNGTEPATEKWRLFTLTARDEAAARAMIKNLRDYLRGLKIEHESHFLQDLAYTLGQRRSIFPWVSCMPAKSLKHLSDTLDSDAVKPSRASKAPRIGFVFTGQGAQWHAMGRELISAYPVFRSTLVEADMCLKDLGSTLSLIGTLAGSVPRQNSMLTHCR
jgi:acyl transferase domain-containing protein